MLSRINKRIALEYLLEIASKQKISQRDLCFGIIDYSHFNRICNGKEDRLSWDIVLNVAGKLNVSTKELFDNCALESANKYNELFNQVEIYKKNYEYSKINEIIKEYQSLKNKSIYEIQLIYYAEAIIDVEINKNYDLAFSKLKNSILLTNPQFKLQLNKDLRKYDVKKYILDKNECMFYNGMVNCLIYKGEYLNASILLENLYDYYKMRNYSEKDQMSLLYNICLCYNTIHMYQEMKDLIERTKFNKFSTLSNLQQALITSMYASALYKTNQSNYKEYVDKCLSYIKGHDMEEKFITFFKTNEMI